MGVILKNNAVSTITTAISASDVGLAVAAGTGTLFPTLGASDYFYATLVSAGGTYEVIKVTARVGDTMTIVRAQEGTTAQSFASGSRMELRVTAASITDMVDEHDQASEISFTPTGGISSNNVQSAITELDSEAAKSATLAANSGSSLIGYNEGDAGAVNRTVQNRLQDYVSVKDFGAVGDGVANDTAAIQAAINSFASGLGTIYFPKGIYLVTSTITVDKDRINLIGAGQWVTRIKFEPTGDDICIFIGKGGEGSTDAGIIVQCSVRGMTFFSSNTTAKKTALELKDISLFECEDVSIGSTTQWIGNGSIGVRVRGREGSSFRNMVVQTNRPFVFARNTSFPSICLDQFNFHNIFTACRGHFQTPPVYNETHFFFEPGANFSNVSFTGFQSWNRGKYGLYYDNSVTAAAGQSYNLNIQNVRWEGTFGDDDTGYAYYFNHGATSFAENILIQNSFLGEIGNGYYFRSCAGVTLINNSWARGSGEALNIDAVLGNEFLQIINCFWQTGCTASIGATFVAINAVRSDNSNTALPFKSVIYTAAQGLDRRDLMVGVPVNQGRISVAAADPTVVTLPLDATATVVGVFADSRGKFAIVGFNVVAKTTTLIYDDGTWSITQGTAAKLNVYWDAGSSTWKVENKTGVSRELYFQALGSNQ